MENYAALSIETHLFFSRIMKEHALFLEAGFPCKEEEWIKKAGWFRQQFEKLLCDVVKIADGKVHDCILQSNELVTEFTIPAEKRTEHLSGIPIDGSIAVLEQNLRAGCICGKNIREINRRIHKMNEWAVCLLNGLIDFQETVLREMSKGRTFNANYPLLIKHITREAKMYRASLQELMQNTRVTYKNLRQTETFWNQIMMEHALFIRGLLDPTEEQLIEAAEGFAEDYKKLLKQAKQQDCRAMDELTRQSLEETLQYRKFKAAGTAGILDCKIASIILPLLADHVLREANHYIRLLETSHV